MSSDPHFDDLERCVAVLGPELTAALCGDVRPPGVRAWVDGVGRPSPSQCSRLHSTRRVLDVFAPSAPAPEVRAWFESELSDLSSQRPVDALRAGETESVLAAANAH